MEPGDPAVPATDEPAGRDAGRVLRRRAVLSRRLARPAQRPAGHGPAGWTRHRRRLHRQRLECAAEHRPGLFRFRGDVRVLPVLRAVPRDVRAPPRTQPDRRAGAPSAAGRDAPRATGGPKRSASSSSQPGDLVLVQPGQSIPVDGTLDCESARVDESLLTGESRPVRKATGDAGRGRQHQPARRRDDPRRARRRRHGAGAESAG